VDKQIFIDHLTTARKLKALLIRISLSLLFITLVASMWITKTQASGSLRQNFKTFSTVVIALVVYVCITIMQRTTRRLGLMCPHCNRPLSGAMSHKTVASGTCYHCGMDVF